MKNIILNMLFKITNFLKPKMSLFTNNKKTIQCSFKMLQFKKKLNVNILSIYMYINNNLLNTSNEC
jgi:hypothetical protein